MDRREDLQSTDDVELGADEAAQHSNSPDQASPPTADALPHRPRAQAKTSVQSLTAPEAKQLVQRTGRVTEIGSHRRHAKTGQTPQISGPSSLGPIAEQLAQIADQLRSAIFQDEADFILDPTPREPGNRDSSAFARGAHIPPHLQLKDKHTNLEECRKIYAAMARESYAKRRKRSDIFKDPELFGEPGWDILLDLYIAQVEEKDVSVSSACIGSAAPPTTGLRWLGVLAEQGLVLREHDPQDQRRVLVRLTTKAMDAMDAYFASSAGSLGDRRAARA